MSDLQRDILEDIHSEQKFGSRAYIDKDTLKITFSWDEINEPNLAFLGVPVTDEDYNDWYNNWQDAYDNINELYLTGDAKESFDRAYSFCETLFEKHQEVLEENGFDSVEDMLAKPYDLEEYIGADDSEHLLEKVREVQDYAISEALQESINSFSHYEGTWQSVSQYKDFLERDSDRVNFRTLDKVITDYCFKNSSNMDQFRNFADDNELDFDYLVTHYEGIASNGDLEKSKLELIVNIIFYFDDYRYASNYFIPYFEMINDEERMELLTNNEYVRIADLVDSGFMPKNKEEALEIVSQSGKLLSYFNEEFGSDIDVVTEAIKNNGWALEYASLEFTDNTKLVLEAVKQNANSIQFASDRIRALCDGNDTIQALESIILQEKLRDELTLDLEQPKKKSVKI